MTPHGAQYLAALRQRGLSVPMIFVRLDAEADRAPSWWRYGDFDWWQCEPEIVVTKGQSVFRLDLLCVAGMTVVAMQHGESDERMNQLIDRLFACGAETVLAVAGESVVVVTDGGRRLVA